MDDSQQHRHLSAELVPQDKQAEALQREQWQAFDRELRSGQLKHLDNDATAATLIWHQPKAENDAEQRDAFYDQLAFCDIADVFRFVDDQCWFLATLTPLQPRYAKQGADADSLMAVIVAQAMNHGNLLMSRTSDIPYHVLQATHEQHLRQATLQAANDCISNAIAELPIFPHYSLDLGTLYGAVDGQKFSVQRPTVKARYSRKYFGRGKGVVAYTLLCNHVPLQGWMIGAHDFEAHHVFDVWYRNTSDIEPEVITGDMHSVNKANFAILHWFGLRFEPRFTDLEQQLKELHCADDPALYANFVVRPGGQVDLQAISDEKDNIDRNRRDARPEGDDPGHVDPKALHLHRFKPDPPGDLRVRQARAQHLHPAVPARPEAAAHLAPLPEPHRVVSPTARRDCPGRRQEGTHRQDRPGHRDQQPVRPVDRQRDRVLQLGDPVAAADEVRD